MAVSIRRLKCNINFPACVCTYVSVCAGVITGGHGPPPGKSAHIVDAETFWVNGHLLRWSDSKGEFNVVTPYIPFIKVKCMNMKADLSVRFCDTLDLCLC